MRSPVPRGRLPWRYVSFVFVSVMVAAAGGVLAVLIQTSGQLSRMATEFSAAQLRVTALSNTQREVLRLGQSLNSLGDTPEADADAVDQQRGLFMRQLSIAVIQFPAESSETRKLTAIQKSFSSFPWDRLDEPGPERDAARRTGVVLAGRSERAIKDLYDDQEAYFFHTNSGSHEANGRSQSALVKLVILVLVLVASWVVMLTRRARNDVARSYDALLKEMQISRVLQDSLAHQAGHDPLTGLANRSRTRELVEAALHRGQRAGTLVGVLFIDLDHFKIVNDMCGHRAGDEVLRVTAQRMLGLVRAGDTVGRLGGDEFVALIEPLTSAGELVDLADRLIAAVSEPISIGGRDVTIGASIGAAVNLDGFTGGGKLLDRADIAAYRAKASGRGRTVFFDAELSRELEDRADQEAAIRVGLAANEFELHYQPVVELTTGAVLGYEALIRWRRPGYGMLSPDSFIPIAEQSDLIGLIDRWVLHEATGQLAAWIRHGSEFEDRTMAVNISGRHLMGSSIVVDVVEALRDAGIPANRLVLEITETVLVDAPTATSHLRTLRELGVAISIDDFGTGYTSIGQLPHLNADLLKIDRSFIASNATGAAELIALMINAAHAFGMHVVAEGIESQDQLTLLRQLGCDSAQGYLFARPQPAADITSDPELYGRHFVGSTDSVELTDSVEMPS